MAISAEKRSTEKLKQWTLNPLIFVQEVFGLDGSPGKQISDQQKEGLECYRRLVTAKLKRARNIPMTEQEKHDSEKVGICVHSGHGTGKTAFASWCMLHFLVTRPYCKIPCIAPVGPQLKTNLWPEVHLWIRKSPLLQDIIKWQAEKIYFKEEAGKEWFAIPRTVNVKATAEEQAETLAGIHADNMLVIVDESSGVPDPVFRPLEGGLTGPLNIVLQIGNPTQSNGFFHDSFTKHRADWMVCHWNAEESELVESSHITRMKRKYGVDSNAYRIRVLGLPPNASPDTVIPWDWIMRAVNRPLLITNDLPRAIGIDCARFGDDKSAIVTMQGPRMGRWMEEEQRIIDGIETFDQLNTIELASWGLAAIHKTQADIAAIDMIGWGAGTYDIMNDTSAVQILPVNVAESSSNQEQYYRLRDELWWNLREDFQNGAISIEDDAELIGELNAPKYNFQRTAKERIKIESKQDLRDRGIASPNKADALILARYAGRYVGPRARAPQRARPRPVSAWVG